VINAPGQVETFTYYYHGPLAIYPLPRSRPLDRQATETELQSILSQHSRIWAVLWATKESDPNGVIEGWLNRHAFKASDQWYGNVRLAIYARGSGEQSAALIPAGVRIGPDITLVAYGLGVTTVASGDIIPITLVWRTSAALSERYKVFTHLVDRHDALWGQWDSEPGGGTLLTNLWQPGQVVTDHYGIPILWGTPPGDYQIAVGMYHSQTGERLAVTSGDGHPLGDHLLVGPVRIVRPETPPPLSALAVTPLRLALEGGLRLLGYDLRRLGGSPGETTVAPQDAINLTLLWQAEARPTHDVTLRVDIVNSQGTVLRTRESGPVDGDYPPTQWSPGEIVRDQHRLALGGLSPGVYQVILTVNGRVISTGQIVVK